MTRVRLSRTQHMYVPDRRCPGRPCFAIGRRGAVRVCLRDGRCPR